MQHASVRKPPVGRVGVFGWIRANLFNNVHNTMLTLLAAYLLYAVVPGFLEWTLIEADWVSTTPEGCRTTDGACWSFIRVKHRVILFGVYPYDEHWRPLAATALFLGLVTATCHRRWWGRGMAAAWLAGLTAIGVLMWGGIFGLSFVPTMAWGGLPLTILLSCTAIFFGFWLSLPLALGRQSNLPAIRAICVGYIELIRGVPLISVLFMASIMLPLFLPSDVTINRLLRAQIGFTMFFAAYMAEVVRGGLQAIPRGQHEAAASLGLTYWQKTALITLPQALKIVIPSMVNVFIGAFKDTSLVVIISMLDLLGTATATINDPHWLGFYIEAYFFIAMIYLVFCFSMSWYSRRLEARLGLAKSLRT